MRCSENFKCFCVAWSPINSSEFKYRSLVDAGLSFDVVMTAMHVFFSSKVTFYSSHLCKIYGYAVLSSRCWNSLFLFFFLSHMFTIMISAAWHEWAPSVLVKCSHFVESCLLFNHPGITRLREIVIPSWSHKKQLWVKEMIYSSSQTFGHAYPFILNGTTFE